MLRAGRRGPSWWLLRGTLKLADLIGHRLPSARPDAAVGAPWTPGLSVLIPDRDSPELLGECLAALLPALALIDEPQQVVISCSGAPRQRYAELQARYPQLCWCHTKRALGYARAIQRGLHRVRHAHVYLLNNDVRLEPQALARVLALRGPAVFAVASQILFADRQRRREETGLTAADGYPDALRIYDVEPGSATPVLEHLYAGGGASLFRTAPLRRYVNQGRAYEPVYWEDVEWGWRARAQGWQIRYCASSIAVHRHRATVNRLYEPAEIERIVARNALQFSLRNLSAAAKDRLLQRFAAAPKATRMELTSPARLFSLLRRRIRAHTESPPVGWYRCRQAIDIRLGRGPGTKPVLLCATPFALLPTTHGGARRTLELLRALSDCYAVVLVSDEGDLYPTDAMARLPWLSALLLVQGRPAAAPAETPGKRLVRHCWPGLLEAFDQACALYPPDRVLVSHEELSDLIERRQPGAHWCLDLHDVNDTLDQGRCRDYDCLLATSVEDLTRLRHHNVQLIANASALDPDAYTPSPADPPRLLFVGNLRYPPNRFGLLQFIAKAWPEIRRLHPRAELHLAGIEPTELQALLNQTPPGVLALGARQDLQQLHAQATLTINPQQQIRGSALKIADSLVAGRVCVSTRSGARGYAHLGCAALICCDGMADMATAINALLSDQAARRRRERAAHELLSELSWTTQARRLQQCLDPDHAAAATANSGQSLQLATKLAPDHPPQSCSLPP